ncbi:lysosomal Pro-X carboxypeptidase-like isoform X2 [Tripterygium wilfordii]|uniref:lysosomal Pro-X carboxypeptidase-like isoform X2 n=1 Tax=Tripterygium wilfordii TaxID=458696 RepID=UPI0018F81C6D|nr:lysosomal Pro-X carboxypeptidase-like isoform X2 [Tripterygium wilfordii]
MTRKFEGSNLFKLPPEFVTFYYTQTLDHYSYRPEGYATFQQRYLLNNKYWGGMNTSSPIFVYMGDEADIVEVASIAGFMVDLGKRFNGLLMYIEHRYYGESLPFGSKDKAFESANNLGYFNSEQALADYAQLITDFKRNMTSGYRPFIAVGGSYGGMLASWFRLKYPHIVIGAVASSAPILYFDDITPQNGYHVVVTKDFRETSENCYNIIRQSWFEIDRVAAEPNGLMTLSNIFSTCRPLNSSQDLKVRLQHMYTNSAQYDNFPEKPVNDICNAIDGAPAGTDILDRVAAGVNASFMGNSSCHRMSAYSPRNTSEWEWQRCTEMVMPMGYGENETMFQAEPFDINEFTQTCLELFNVAPRPHWITTQFGGHDIKFVFGNFATNIIFSNGLRDPYSAGGVLQDISDSVVAVYTNQGAHGLDLHAPLPNDPDWLVAQRDREIKIIQVWIAEYNAKLARKMSK